MHGRVVAEYRLTPRALSDLDNIADHSLERWGAARAALYLESLQRRFQWLAENPDLGRNRDEIAPRYRSFPEGQHVIFYVVMQAAIAIIGVPHGAMDITSDTLDKSL